MYPEFNDLDATQSGAPQPVQEQTQYQPPMQEQPQYQPPVQQVPVYHVPQPNPYGQPAYTPPKYQAPEQPPKPPKKKGNGGKWVAIVTLCLCCSLLGGVLGAVFYSKLNPSERTTVNGSGGNTVIQEGTREPTVITPAPVDTGKLLTAAEVYATYVNSTVGITTSITTNFWGYQSTSAASGSGFILSEDGYVVTNFHVIEDSNSITVSMYDGTVYDAKLVGYDESNDIAVLKIDAKGLSPVVLGKSDDMYVGDNVVAIGNPLGELTFSLTAGTVSALNRDVTMSNGVVMTLIQTDCAINSGNSGGALFNMYGEVVGITNAKYSSSSYSEASIDNIGFAIPIDDVKGIIESIIEKGYVSKPYIGVSVADVSEESQSYGLPQGAAVREIVEGSPAEASGLQVNDIITHANGEPITGSSELVAVVRDCETGDVLNLTVYRRGETLEISITVGEQVQTSTQQEQTGSDYEYIFPGFGY